MRKELKNEPIQGLDGDLEIDLVPGNPGQFDVMVDGEQIATRAKGWQRFLGGGWPTPQDVADALRARV